MIYPRRKHPRLKAYDYSQCGGYHLTICTRDRKPILSRIVPAPSPDRQAEVKLLPVGKIVSQYVQGIPDAYRGVFLDHYVIMPNHVHLLIVLTDEAEVSVSTIVRSLKSMVAKAAGRGLWQDSFYDVVIRNDNMYRCEWTYIDNNPDKWVEDNLYVAQEDCE